MKKLFLSLFIFFLTISSSFAQTSFFGGLNIAESTNKGFWGLNPTLEVEQNIASNLNIDLRINGFFDVHPNAELMKNVKIQEHHRSFYSDLGLNVKIINKKVDWSIGAGGSYQVGGERYLSGAGYYDGELTEYQIYSNNFSRVGFFIKNTLDFGEAVSFNLTVYRFRFWGEYMSFGPSFKLN